MLGTNYLTINGLGYTPSDFSYEIQAVEDINDSEAGTELINVRRLNKYVFYATWEGIDASVLNRLIAYCGLQTVTVEYQNVTYVCRARGINPRLIKKAYKYRASDGLWNVSVTFTQI